MADARQLKHRLGQPAARRCPACLEDRLHPLVQTIAVGSHLAAMGHRSEVVEYRLEQHVATLGGRLTALTGETL